ncbi:MAG: M24 family metallopeptidase [Christensenellales bacterium]
MDQKSRLQTRLSVLELDGMLILRPENRMYFSGFSGSTAALLITGETACIFSDFRYRIQIALQCPAFHYIETPASYGLLENVVRYANDLGIRRLGFEEDYLTVSNRDMLECYKGELVKAAQLPYDLRKIKCEDEIASMQAAADIASNAFQSMLSCIRVGDSELDIAAELEYRMKKGGAQDVSFQTIVASGPNSAMPHAVPSARKIASGDLLVMDFGCRVDGYCSDMTRTIGIGSLDRKQKEVYAIVAEAQRLAMEKIRAGMKCFEIDLIARQYIAQKGYGEQFGHGLGHSLGLAVHEEPRFSPLAPPQSILEAGMVLSVEPGIYIPGLGGVRIEDVCLITGDGYNNMTKADKHLIII